MKVVKKEGVKIKNIIAKLNEASEAYYKNDNPIMSDKEYDKLYDELIVLEKSTGIIMSNSPTQKVQGYILDGLKKVKHSKPMLSAAKTKNIDDVEKFVGGKEFYGSYKLDGLTLIVKYQNGEFFQAITRGSGDEGEDVTEQAKMIINLPMQIPYKDYLELRGECVISWSNFRRINDKLEQQYSHPRNLAAASIRQLNTNICKDRNLEFLVFECVSDLKLNSKWDTLKKINSFGFTSVGCGKGTVDNISEALQPEYYQYPVDGLIFELDDIVYSKSLGATGHHELCRIALKWADSTYKTTLRNVEWDTSRTGVISPVAVFDEVDLEGALTTRATLHNISYIEKLELGIGDDILVYRANMVIPKVDDNLTRSNSLSIPHICPICGGKTSIQQDNNSKVLICTNAHCKGKLIGRFTHFVSKRAMDIDGLSEATLEKFIEKDWLNTFKDIYHLQRYKDEIIKMDGFGQKSYTKLLKSIEASRNVKLENFIVALGIPNIGRTASKAISKFCNGSWDVFEGHLFHNIDWTFLTDFGTVANDSLHSFYENEYGEWAYELSQEMNFVEPAVFAITKDATPQTLLQEKTFVITGSLNCFANRDELVAKIESMGGKCSGSVSKSTNYLINNDTQSSSGKNQKAKQLGVEIINEEQFTKMIGENK